MAKKLVKHSTLPANIHFEVVSKLGSTIHTTKQYWNVITRVKHPTIQGKEEQVREALRDPDVIRKSKSDSNVYLFYKRQNKHYIAVVVRHVSKKQGFIITGYLTRNIKEGKQIWPKTTKKIK